MKKYSFGILGILACVAVLISCEDYLNKSPESDISGEEAFENFNNFQGYVEELYHTIPDFNNAYWTNSWNWGDDEVSDPDMNYHIVDMFDNGNFWGWQTENNGWNTSWMNNGRPVNSDLGARGGIELWEDGWYAIRKASVGLQNIDQLQGTQEQKDLIEGQLLFFRAWFHFQFMQYFGDMPYLNEPLPADAQFDQTRIEYQALADSVGQDFRRAADLLPLDWDNTEVGRATAGNNTLRINKIMALGYLGKNYLWAASPLMNNGADENVGSYNQEYAKKAAEAFGELLSLTESGQADYALVPFSEYQSIFYTNGQNWQIPGGSEAIFRGPYYAADQSNYGTSKQYMPPVVGIDADNFFPTANYANNFGMANGLPLDENDSGYDSEYPWRDRDPRFYKTYLFDGIQVVQGSMPAGEEPNRNANLYTGGSYRYDNGARKGGSQTGYILRKFTPITANNYDQGWNYGNNLNIHMPWMRLGGVYVMYAEAAAAGFQSATGKASNYSKTAVEAINTVRDRAGVDPVANRYLGNADDFMGEVRREWAVELGFEKHRFTNLRRWMLIAKPEYANKTAIFFDRADTFDPENPQENRVLNLREEVIKERNYTSKHYWLPLKRADVTISNSFKQNPGW